ncbi:hypothetical protein FACS189483_01370 [Spirochaetia bacterium]|nr:hypothetical protein FACS189483_01370 [Spirochaetia bacterium]
MKKMMMLLSIAILIAGCDNSYVEGRITEFIDPPEPETPAYTINIDTVTGGAATITPVREKYLQGDYVKLTAVPAAGYTFVKWSGTASATENPYIFTASKNEWVIPVFSRNAEPPAAETYTIRVDPVSGGHGEIEPEKAAYSLNETVKITATPETGYTFSGWSGTLTSTQNPVTFKVSTDHWIIPQFAQIPVYTLTTDCNPGGKITRSTGDKTTFHYGEKCLLQAQADPNYRFIRWEGDIESTSETISITFDQNYQVYARFEIIPVAATYTLTTSAANGSITRTPDKSTYYENEKVRITAVPTPGSRYMFADWDSSFAGNPQEFEIVMDSNKSISTTFIERKWTFIVYMAADNNLEAAAIADFNELESVDYTGQPVSVLVLLDRGPGYDATNGNWTDTRLYEVKTDPNGNNATIISKRLSSTELGLSAASDTELDMALPSVLSQLIGYTQRVYTAENYGLIIWGHGTGWKSGGSGGGTMPEPVKAIAIDDTSSDFMDLPSFGSVITNKGLKVIGFDTCFGALLEVAYQIKDSGAEYLLASEGLIPSNGWDYGSLFTSFFTAGSLTPDSFCAAAINQYSTQYNSTVGSTISQIYLPGVANFFAQFESFSHSLADAIISQSVRNQVLNEILTGTTIDRYNDAPPSDLYIDIFSFSSRIHSLMPSISVTALHNALNTAVPVSWSQKDNTARKNIGIYVISLQSAGVPSASHDSGYFNGNANTSAFVQQSQYWVPHAVPQATSVLDKLFYSGY